MSTELSGGFIVVGSADNGADNGDDYDYEKFQRQHMKDYPQPQQETQPMREPPQMSRQKPPTFQRSEEVYNFNQNASAEPPKSVEESTATKVVKGVFTGVFILAAIMVLVYLIILFTAYYFSSTSDYSGTHQMGGDTADMGETEAAGKQLPTTKAPDLPTIAAPAADANATEIAAAVAIAADKIIAASEERDRVAAEAKKMADSASSAADEAERLNTPDAVAKREFADKAVAISLQRADEAKEGIEAKKIAIAAAKLATSNAAKAEDKVATFEKKLYSDETTKLTEDSPRAAAWADTYVANGITKEITLSDSNHYTVYKASNGAVRVLEKRKATNAEIESVKSKGLMDANYPKYKQLWVNHNSWSLGYWSSKKELGRSHAMDDFYGGRPYRVWDLTYDGKKKYGAYFHNYKAFNPGSDGKQYTMQDGSFVVLWPIKVSQATYVVPYTCSMVSPADEKKKGFGWVNNQGQYLPAGFDGVVKFRFHVRPGEAFSLKYCNNVSLHLRPENPTKEGSARIGTPLVARSYLTEAPSVNPKFTRYKTMKISPK